MAVQTGIAMINEENLEVASVQSNDDFTIPNPSQSYPDDLDLTEENFTMVCIMASGIARGRVRTTTTTTATVVESRNMAATIDT